jgi:F-type H+-transporting ATPase subunit delta
MAEPVTVARPYAEAAFRLGNEQNRLAAWSEMLATLDTLVADEQVQALSADPNVSGTVLESMLLGVVGERFDGAARNLVQVLVQNGRLELVPHIRVLFEALRSEHEGVIETRILTAMPLADAQLNELVKALETKYGKKIRATVEVDAQLIGGVRIIMGDKVIDGTVRGKLEAMATALTH